MKPEMIADYQCVTGEGPLWHPMENRLYWTDIPTGRMFRYDPATGHHEQIYQGEMVGGFTIQADGALLLFGERGSVRLWRDGQLTTVIDELADERETRFNDVFADTEGRVFCGTMSTRQRKGRLYRLDTDGSIHLILEGIGCSNGMGFTPDRKCLYYTDTTVREIYLFDYDAATGALSNQRLFVRTPEGEGGPDGMTVDAEGYVWSARWDGGHLFRYSPDGQEVMRVPFPAKKVSCVTFGGPDYTDMYVTTAGGNRKETEGEGAGALFRVNLGIRGLPEYLSRVGL
ncbi:MAG TPA: SMP-30/gluconolactonase/LRE family protein [Chloroflexi bacterium]|jgi:sugar lactone lactonase YvrE|nr:SMP-30/gluconolactonase/LRE family protein [Chloroflexota bacterium]